MGVVVGVDGGNSKTDAVLATSDGEPLAYVRGGGSNSHGPGGSAGCVEVVASLVARLPFEPPADRAVLFLCGADLPRDLEELSAEVAARAWTGDAIVDNDTFALLHAGTDRREAVAVICGAGINCVGRAAGRVVRYPALGWETGDWGGSEDLGRKALYHANRAADGRGEPTVLVDAIEAHFGKTVVEVGADVHYRRLPQSRLGELAPRILGAACADDPVARTLVDRLADEIVLLVERALRDLSADDVDTVLGGGMLADRGHLYSLVADRVPNPSVPELPPVAGAVLAALEGDARRRFRRAFRDWRPRG